MTPTITGEIVSFSITGTTETQLSDQTLDAVKDHVSQQTNVQADDIGLETEYSTTGTLNIADPSDLDSVKNAMSDLLDIHPKDIHLKVDETTGKVTYKITNNDFDDLVDSKATIESDKFFDNFKNQLEEQGVELLDIDSDNEIGVEITTTVDVTGVDQPSVDIETTVPPIISDLGFDVSLKSNTKTF